MNKRDQFRLLIGDRDKDVENRYFSDEDIDELFLIFKDHDVIDIAKQVLDMLVKRYEAIGKIQKTVFGYRY